VQWFKYKTNLYYFQTYNYLLRLLVFLLFLILHLLN
jgi:hypothetical protein